MLTASVMTQTGPILLETFLKHYFSKKPTESSEARGELLYDEAFVLTKTFLEISTRHTVEDLQKFGLTKTPTPPWVLTHRVLIPLTPVCTKAGDLLVQALGGPEMAMKMAGGSKWWRVRMQAGVEAEWIGIKKDWRQEEIRLEELERQRKKADKGKNKLKDRKGTAEEQLETDNKDDGLEGEFTPEMDNLRCMLYIHGGAGYWGSINTHRYTIWRYARKMRGRCFAVNYRKAPQFPWPCALHDCLAAYLYLIDPPPKSKHKAVDPKNLIIAGDSLGGNLALSLLQVIRDAGLPVPSGGVLISPWCDLTHSFPSVMQNTATDIIPPYGFLHRPSTLWPPPPPELTKKVQETLRVKVKDAVHRLTNRKADEIEAIAPQSVEAVEIDTATSAPKPTSSADGEDTTARGDTKLDDPEPEDGEHSATLFPATEKHPEHHPGPTDHHKDHPQSISDPTKEKHTLTLDIDGKPVHIRSQIQLYCTNDQLSHPYVSPALGNLAGLPPLLIIASNNEVLRDEIIYAAHKAAQPDKYPIRDSVKDLLPNLKDCEGKYPPTQVHLQVYDGTCHVLPMLSFTEPAKHCYRAIASWCKFVTSRHPHSQTSQVIGQQRDDLRTQSTDTVSIPSRASSSVTPNLKLAPPIWTPTAGENSQEVLQSPTNSRKSSLHAALDHLSLMGSSRKGSTSPSQTLFPDASSLTPTDQMDYTEWEGESPSNSLPTTPIGKFSENRDPFGGPSPFDDVKVPKNIPRGYAGNYEVYSGPRDKVFEHNPIRERVSTRGECRPLEDASQLEALTMPLAEIGVVKEAPAERYLRGQKLWDDKYKKFAKRAEKDRQANLERAKEDYEKGVKAFNLHMKGKKNDGDEPFDEKAYIFGNDFSWKWALDGEQPPPSACIGRRDTSEARKLALMADRLTDESVQLSGLSLWTAMASFLSRSQGQAGPGEVGPGTPPRDAKTATPHNGIRKRLLNNMVWSDT